MPPLSLQRPARGPLLAGRRRPQYAGPLDVRAAPGVAERARPANGPMPRPASMATCSTSSARALGFATSATSPTRRGAFSSCLASNRSTRPRSGSSAAPAGSPEAARRLFAMSQPIEGTLVETYLAASRHYALASKAAACASIRAATIGLTSDLPTETWPAMIACVTDLDGTITGAHRTWLDPDGFDRVRLGKAPIDTPRRAMGDLLGNAVRFGVANDVLAAGEGIETMLSLAACCRPCRWRRRSRPRTSPPSCSRRRLRRLYIARDDDPAGDGAVAALIERADAAGIEAIASVAPARRLQRGSARLRPRCTAGSAADSARAAGRRPLPAPGGHGRIGRVGALSMSTWSVAARPTCRREPRPRPSRGRSDGKRPGPAMAAPGYFPPAPLTRGTRLCIAKQNSRPPPSSAALRPSAVAPGAGPVRPPSGDRHEGRDGRGRSDKGPSP